MTIKQLERAGRYDRRMFEIMNQGTARPLYATRGRRRALVAVHATLTAAVLAAEIFCIADDRPWLLLAATVVLVPLWCVAMGGINAATRGLLELRARVLDEWQIAQRQRVLARAHRISVAALLGGVVALLVAGRVRGAAVSLPLLPVAVVTLVTFWLMPAWTACLMVRDEVPDEEEFEAQAA
ncbi:hypothetical protein ACFP1Z_22400 [Streptomyces gamaensis]|uniref:Integral membrane protein n=1 Tax=Streptomyces gamaensis TaxID=1763542 RepID=A0ABW0Z2F3_9ACTN